MNAIIYVFIFHLLPWLSPFGSEALLFDRILIKRAYLIRQGAIFNLNDEPLCQVYCQAGSVSGVGDVSDVFSVTSWQF